MSRARIAAFVFVVGFITCFAQPAWADNCGSFSDCLNVLGSGLLALGGALVFGLGTWAFGSRGGTGSSGGASGAGGGGPGSGGGDGGEPGAPPPAAPPPVPPIYNPDNMPPTPDAQKKLDDARDQLARDLANKRPIGEWLHNINPTGNQNNCVEAAKAVDSSLAGQPSTAQPTTHGPNRGDLEQSYPGRTLSDSSVGGITSHVQAGGPGTRGIIVVYEGGESHVINVVNDNGTVRFIDGQQNRVSTNGTDLLAKDGYTSKASVSYLQTYPP